MASRRGDQTTPDPEPHAEFADWIEWHFKRPESDLRNAWYWDDEVFEYACSPLETAEWLTTLYHNAGALLQPYSNTQVGLALNYFTSPSCSDTMFCIDDERVTHSQRLELIESIYDLFAQCIAQRCANRFGYKAGDGPLAYICGMWWDVIPYWPGSERFIQSPDLCDAVLGVMQRTLEIPHLACQGSALHGLGHWHDEYPDRTQKIIDDWLAQQTDLPQDIVEYAGYARTGSVQ